MYSQCSCTAWTALVTAIDRPTCCYLVPATKQDVSNVKLLHTLFDGAGATPANYGNLDARVEQAAHAVAVLSMERLGLDAVIREIESAVCEDAVDIERHEADAAQPVEPLAHIRPSRNRS